MAPPSYADLGKAARDLFNKGHHVGNLKVDITNKTGFDKEYESKISATHDLASETLVGNFDWKWKLPEQKVTFTEKLTSKNTLTSVVEISDLLAKGSKVTLEGGYNLKNEQRSANFKTEVVKPNFKFNSNVSLLGNPIIDASAVYDLQSTLVGIQTIIDAGSRQVKATNVTLSKVTPDFALTAFFNESSIVGASIFQRASPKLDLGVQVSYKVGEGNTTYGLAAKYDVASDLSLKGKINNASDVVLSATHRLNKELAVTGSTQFSLLSSKNGQNKIGFGIEYSV
uniref:Voltage-dependent anion-selective channel n=1 Tax=Strongyloides stercoralis TaxID=6248 RepID=A0A0K0EJG1_STRER